MLKQYLIPSLLTITLLTTGSCSKKAKKQAPPVFPVKSANVVQKEVPYYADTIGHISPYITIDVRSRVEGELVEVFFNEGDEVQEGDLLFTIDPRPFQAALEKAQGELKENQANLKLALDKVERYEPLLEEEYISQLDFDQLKTDVALYNAMIDQNKAQIKEAKLNVEYAHIYAPVTGKTSLLNIQKGNLISADGSKNLVSIKQLMPIYTLFSLPERELATLQEHASNGSIKIRVSPKDLDKDYTEGTLNMINNTIDPEIGSIEIRGIFDNYNKKLWPGEFVKVRVVYKMIPEALLIPNEAVVMTTQGPITYVIESGSVVKMKKLTLGQRQGSNIVVTSGVAKNDTVVTFGQLNIYDGATVSIVDDNQEDES